MLKDRYLVRNKQVKVYRISLKQVKYLIAMVYKNNVSIIEFKKAVFTKYNITNLNQLTNTQMDWEIHKLNIGGYDNV